MTETFHVMCKLHDTGRDHIWAYYVRNLARPTWLAEENNRVDIVLGNPPWLTYNAIATDLKPAFRQACEERNLWGGRTVRNYDLSALFVARAIELYLKWDGRFAFVMPRAVLYSTAVRGLPRRQVLPAERARREERFSRQEFHEYRASDGFFCYTMGP